MRTFAFLDFLEVVGVGVDSEVGVVAIVLFISFCFESFVVDGGFVMVVLGGGGLVGVGWVVERLFGLVEVVVGDVAEAGVGGVTRGGVGDSGEDIVVVGVGVVEFELDLFSEGLFGLDEIGGVVGEGLFLGAHAGEVLG